MDAAYAANAPASPQALTALCHRYSHPVATSAMVRHRRYKAHSAATSLCGNAGCAYIWLLNDANGFGEAEYEAAAYYPLLGGRAAFTRYTKSNNSTAGWTDSMEHNCGADCWFGYRYIHPIKGSPNVSWVSVQGEAPRCCRPATLLGVRCLLWNYTTWH